MGELNAEEMGKKMVHSKGWPLWSLQGTRASLFLFCLPFFVHRA